MECAICQLENPENSHFWKIHRLRESDYYLKHFPKTDKLTGEQLSFKDRDSYLLLDFANKNNRNKWFKLQNLETRRNYLRQLLVNRRELKGWEYCPTQVELRSCPELVGINTFNENFDNYYDLCIELGYKSRGFNNLNKNSILKRERNLRGNPILIDSREQDLLQWNNKEVKIGKLDVGDYSIERDSYGISIERKSLNDLTGTFGPKNFDRFRCELIRTKESSAYLLMLVENDFNTVLGFDHSPFYNKHTQMTATYLFHQIRVLLQEFDCWQIAFCKNRTDMTEKIKFIFEMGEKAKTIDWQLALDLKIVNNNI